MLASARRRACTAGYHLPAAARLRAICRPGDLARRKPRAAANSPGGRERPPYIRRQTCGKIENGRLPQSPRNEFRFRQNCTEPHTTPAQGRMLASARRRACAADTACLPLPACGRFAGRAISPAENPAPPQAPPAGVNARPTSSGKRTARPETAGRRKARATSSASGKTVPSHTPPLRRGGCLHPPAAGPVRRDTTCLRPPACGRFAGRAISPAGNPAPPQAPLAGVNAAPRSAPQPSLSLRANQIQPFKKSCRPAGKEVPMPYDFKKSKKNSISPRPRLP